MATATKKTAAVLKYEASIKPLENCPPAGRAVAKGVGYRHVFADIAHKDNFRPIAEIDPDRIVGKPAKFCCSAFALSLCLSVDDLRARAQKVLGRNQLFLKKVGDHYACLALGPTAGECTHPDQSGHFDLFEYAEFDGRKVVQEHLPLYPNETANP